MPAKIILLLITISILGGIIFYSQQKIGSKGTNLVTPSAPASYDLTQNGINTDKWKTYQGQHFSYKYPPNWTPTHKNLNDSQANELFDLGIPGIETYSQQIGVQNGAFDNLLPENVILTNSIIISDKNGLKWQRKGGSYFAYDYFCPYTDQNNFGISVTLPAINTSLEKTLDAVANSVILQ